MSNGRTMRCCRGCAAASSAIGAVTWRRPRKPQSIPSRRVHHATDDRRIVHAVPDPSRTHRQGLPRSRAVALEEPHMSRRSRIWLAVAVVFTLVNLGGAVVAIAAGEAAHTAPPAVLLLVGGAWVWRLAPSRSASRDG